MGIVTPEWIEKIETTAKTFKHCYLENDNLLLITDELKTVWQENAELKQKLSSLEKQKVRGRW